MTRSIKVDPTLDPIVYHNLARLFLRKRQFVQAWRILEECIERFPRNHSTPEVQALVLMEQKRLGEAIDLLRNEIATGEASVGTYATLGWYLTDLRPDLGAAQETMLEGLKRYPQAPELINNLAYSLLMSGKHVEARKVLVPLPSDEKALGLENRAALTATWGLLHLWEGDLSAGKACYERAEEIARESLQRNLPLEIRQKKHLEVARVYLRRNDIAAAKAEISRGLLIREGREVYEHDLASLDEVLKGI